MSNVLKDVMQDTMYDTMQDSIVKYGTSDMASVVSSAVFDLDATMINSYGGTGQTWSNLIATPADGSSQTAYDFYLGATSSATTDDPTFNGTAGTSSAYFSVDGGDLFTLKSGTNTTFFNNIHKTTGGSAGWMALALNVTDGGAIRIMGTKSAANTNGLLMSLSSSELITITQGNGTADVGASFTGPTGTLPIGNPAVVIVSWSAGGTTMKRWMNNRSSANGTATWGTTTTNPTAVMSIARSLTTGSLIYAASMGNALLTDADAAKIFEVYNYRHNRNYA